MVDKNLESGDRCFFGLSIATVIVAATYLIARVYDKWSTTPVIVGINPQPTFITDEPFPAVTICNLNHALNDSVEMFSINSSEYTMLQLLCKRDVNRTVVKSIANWNHLEKFIVNISQPCEDMLVDCHFGGIDYNCSKMFYPLVTDEGFCCTFNMLHPKYMYISHIPLSYSNVRKQNSPTEVDWYSEYGYPNSLPSTFNPHKVPGVGESLGLSVTIDVQEDKYYCSSSNSIGFKFAIHSPNETPNIHEIGVFVEPGKETNMQIRPEKTESDRNLRKMSTKLRQCLFHSERRLKFFAHYTQRNCEMECVAEISWQYCGCLSFYMPKIYSNASVCSINQMKCETAVRMGAYNAQTSCFDDCLPGCFEMDYDVEVFATRLAHRGLIYANPNLAKLKRSYVVKNVAIVHMFFSGNTFRSNLQTKFIGLSDFLFFTASVGGLMSLFLGFSFLSIAECIYYAVIHPCRTVRKYQKMLDLKKKKFHKIHPMVEKYRLKRFALKNRYKNQLQTSNHIGMIKNPKTMTVRHTHIKVPYSITYGFDEVIDDDVQLPYCE
ncbi:pickpocket protein 28-like [Haematobia irritans]|uniref:pickpocket protein 28-like n=1 Tax=Haematobia irritans TaxID=7368 RepID=UPI003F5099E9